MVGSRIVNVFKKKIYTLFSAFNRAKRAGGKSLTKLMNVWDVGPKYKFTIYYNELDVVNVAQENRQLKGENRKLENDLQEESNKRMHTEEELNATRALLVSNQKKYKQKFKQLVNKVARLSTKKKCRGPDKKKSFSEYSSKQQSRIRNQLKEQCQTTLSFFGQYDIIPSKIELFNYDTGDVESFDLLDNDTTELLLPNTGETKVPKNEIDDMNMWLYVKDKFNISNEAWTELSMKSDDQPCLYKIIKHMQKLNKKWKLKPTPGKTEGVQISFKETLIDHAKRLKTSGKP